MATKIIRAVAVGAPANNTKIDNGGNRDSVRPYILGLIKGLEDRKLRVGTDYVIDYRENTETALKSGDGGTFKPERDVAAIFCMSATVVEAAQTVKSSLPILGIVSEPGAHGLRDVQNIGGVSPRRSQTAGDCFTRFLATVPSLKVVRALHKPGYGPSERALELVKVAAARRGVTVTVVTFGTKEEIKKKLLDMAPRDPSRPAEVGLQLLPVDVGFSAARDIIEIAQGQKKLPTFFPVTDWVTSKLPSALGGYGVPQHTCGLRVAKWAAAILKGDSASLKFEDVPDSDFKWMVSKAAAADLNIQLPEMI